MDPSNFVRGILTNKQGITMILEPTAPNYMAREFDETGSAEEMIKQIMGLLNKRKDILDGTTTDYCLSRLRYALENWNQDLDDFCWEIYDNNRYLKCNRSDNGHCRCDLLKEIEWLEEDLWEINDKIIKASTFMRKHGYIVPFNLKEVYYGHQERIDFSQSTS